MIHIKTLFPVLSILFLNNLAFGQAIDSLKKDPNILIKKEYSIEIPVGWRIMDKCEENLCSILSPSDTLTFLDPFVENINFTVQPLPSTSYTADKYLQFSKGYLPKVVTNFKIHAQKKINSFTSLLVYSGTKSGFDQTWKQYYYAKRGKIYIVTFACETPKYEYYIKIVDPYLATFKLK